VAGEKEIPAPRPGDANGLDSTTALLVDRKLVVRHTAGSLDFAGDEALLGIGLVEALAAPDERRTIERAARLALGGQASTVDLRTGTFGSRRVRFSPLSGRLNGGRGVLVAIEPALDGKIRELETRARDLSALSSASNRLARADDAYQVGTIVCETAAEVATADFAALLQPHGDGSALVVTGACGAELEGALSMGEPSLATTAFRFGRQVYSDQLKRGESTASWPLNGVGAHAAIWQPVRGSGGVQAVLVVGWRRRLTMPGERIKASLELLADEAAVTMERSVATERLKLLARTDPLTELYNRRHWRDELARELGRAERFNEQLSIGLIDIDNLKQLNDWYGHKAGDRLLMTASARWRRRLRVTDVLARIGGDEFAMTLPNCSIGEAASLGNDLRGAMPEGFSCSVGVAEWIAGEPAESLLARADQALYVAKQQGRDRTVPAPGPGEVAA